MYLNAGMKKGPTFITPGLLLIFLNCAQTEDETCIGYEPNILNIDT